MQGKFIYLKRQGYMERRQIFRQQLIEDVHISLKRENRARSVNKAQSELMISEQERQVNRLKRDARKMQFDTYQEMSTFMGTGDEDDIK